MTLGILMALVNYLSDKSKEKKEKEHEAKLNRALAVAQAVESANGVQNDATPAKEEE